MKFLTKYLFLAIAIFTFSFNLAFAENINVYVNNYKYTSEQPVKIINGVSYVALSDFANITGAVTSWEAATKTATLTYEEKLSAFNNNSLSFSDTYPGILVNGINISTNNPTKLINNKLFVPANILSKYMGYSLSFDKSKNNLLINSTATNLMDKPDFSKISLLPVLEKSMGKETYNQFKYTFVTADEPKGEKYLTNGKYAIFTAHEKGYEPNKLNGFFYLNIYTNDVYFYPASSEHEELAKKYNNGIKYEDFHKNGGKNTVFLVATARMLDMISLSDSSLSDFSYVGIDKLTVDYTNHLPKGEYYFYKATKKSDGKDSNFEVAQNKSTLDVFLFLRKKDGVNIVKLPDMKILEVVAKK